MSDDPLSPWNTDSKWHDLTARQKFVFLGKLVAMLVTFGFAFPNLLAED